MQKKSITIILLALVFIIILFFFFNNKQVENPTTPKLETSYGFNLPFSLSEEQINQSLKTQEPITIKPVELNWPEIINNSLLKSGWILVSMQEANDGGSKFYLYSKSKEIPEVKFSYHWDLLSGGFKSLDISFVPSPQ